MIKGNGNNVSSNKKNLETAIEWSFSLSTNVLIRVCTNSIEDHRLRVNLSDDLKKTLSENLSSFD